MNKIIFFTTLSISFAACAFAQNGQWIWMGGDTIWNSDGHINFSNVGNPDSSNVPPAALLAANWTDKEGNFWMYSGLRGYGFYYDWGFDHLLWKFNPNSKLWTLVRGGYGAIYPVYGIKGVPDSANTPGSRAGSVSWTDTSGNLWLFGGAYYTSVGQGDFLAFNDLWKYNISTNEWVWMKGYQVNNDPGIYGTKGVPANNNSPGTRTEAVGWVDKENNLWLYGGLNFLSGDKLLNDLWKYNISTNQWTWIDGAEVTDFFDPTPYHYGTIDVEDTLNYPKARAGMCGWKDVNDNFYFFSGYDYGHNERSDMWRYNRLQNAWTWIKGDSTITGVGNSGISCEYGFNNFPVDREFASSCIDRNGNFWLMGGFIFGLDTMNGNTLSCSTRDLWRFNQPLSSWAKVYKDSLWSYGYFGQMGVYNTLNDPPSRERAVMWSDEANNIWLFGGGYYGTLGITLNDLWKYIPDTVCAVATNIHPILKDKLIDIYPNPFSNKITVEFLSKDYEEMMISDLLGHQIIKQRTYHSPLIIDLSKLPVGVYILTMLSSGDFINEVIIKER